MRRHEKERPDHAFQEAVLTDADTLWLSFNTEGAPYVIPVNHVLHNGALYVHCAPEGLKIDLLRKDASVGFAAATDIEIIREKATTRYRSVCGSGRITEVRDEEEIQEALAAVSRRFQSICKLPAPASMLARLSILRIDIEKMTGKQS